MPLVYEENYIRSPMNYIGGKYKLLPQLLPLFPKGIEVFVDLFCGGCTVGLNVNARKVLFNDNLIYLIDLYNVFMEEPVEFILDRVERRIREYGLSRTNETGYKNLRRLYNEKREPLDLFVLAAYSFNHQIRFNSSHEFNTPFGRNRSSYNGSMKKNLCSFLEKIHNTQIAFSCCDFESFDLSGLSANDFVYCDPPYLISTGTYNDGKRGFTGWDKNREESLLHILDSVDQKGIKFALSNVLSHRGKTNELLKKWIESRGYYTMHLRMSYSNSNYQITDRNAEGTDEVLVTNYIPSKH